MFRFLIKTADAHDKLIASIRATIQRPEKKQYFLWSSYATGNFREHFNES